MPYCCKCGRELEERARFCPDCGTPNVKAAPPGPPDDGPGGPGPTPPPAWEGPPPRPKTKKRLVAILCGTAAVVIVAAALLISGVFASPAQKFLKVQQDFVLDRAVEALKTYIAALDWTPETSAYDLAVSAVSTNPEIDQYLDGTEFSLQVVSSEKKAEMTFDFQLMDDMLLSGYASYQDGVAGLCIPELDSEYYTFDVKRVLCDATGTKLPDIDAKLFAKLVDRYVDLLLSVVTKESVSAERGQTAELAGLGERVTGCTLYTFSPRAEDMEAMLLTLADTMEGDQELRDYMLLLAVTDDIAESTDDILAQVIAQLRENAGDDAREAERFTWQVYVKGGAVCKQYIEIGGDALTYEGLGDKKDHEALLYIGDYETAEFAYGFSRAVDGKKQSGEFRMFAPNDPALDYSLRYDINTGKQSALGVPYGTYRMDAMSLHLRMDVESAGSGGGTDHVITLRAGEELQWDFYPLYALTNEVGISEITLHTTDKKPDIQAPDRSPIDITDYGEYELYEIFDDAVRKFGGQIYGLYG